MTGQRVAPQGGPAPRSAGQAVRRPQRAARHVLRHLPRAGGGRDVIGLGGRHLGRGRQQGGEPRNVALAAVVVTRLGARFAGCVQVGLRHDSLRRHGGIGAARCAAHAEAAVGRQGCQGALAQQGKGEEDKHQATQDAGSLARRHGGAMICRKGAVRSGMRGAARGPDAAQALHRAGLQRAT